ncbi:MAG: LysR family transcriptional regulator [Deltaproteobacteria bacterium]|nr:LysR family transcriptional regulator [Deltaproteobacteria bacterium]
MEESFDIKAKIWLEKDGEPVFGMGRLILLKKIESSGSISAAAKELKYSYKKAWSFIALMEKRFGFELVNKKIGGKHGGGSVLTKEAKNLINMYEELLKKEEKFLENYQHTL